jgi:hypothetical protein
MHALFTIISMYIYVCVYSCVRVFLCLHVASSFCVVCPHSHMMLLITHHTRACSECIVFYIMPFGPLVHWSIHLLDSFIPQSVSTSTSMMVLLLLSFLRLPSSFFFANGLKLSVKTVVFSSSVGVVVKPALLLPPRPPPPARSS